MNTAPNNKRIIINNAADVRTLIKMIDTWHESYDVAAIRVGRGSPVIIFTFSISISICISIWISICISMSISAVDCSISQYSIV